MRLRTSSSIAPTVNTKNHNNHNHNQQHQRSSSNPQNPLVKSLSLSTSMVSLTKTYYSGSSASSSSSPTSPTNSTPSSPLFNYTLTASQALMAEVTQNHTYEALELIKSGKANPNVVDPIYGWSVLHLAAKEGKLELAIALLQAGAVVDSKDATGQTPLHRAAFWGKDQIVRILLDRGADFTALDAFMQTPEDLARMRGHLELAVQFEQLTAFLVVNGLPRYTPQQTKKMVEQLRLKRDDEEKRAELKQELSRHVNRAAKESKQVKLKEAKALEKRDTLIRKAEKYKAEIQHMASIENSPAFGLTKKEVKRLRELQEKLKRTQEKLMLVKAKINFIRTKSLGRSAVHTRGEAWIEFINAGY